MYKRHVCDLYLSKWTLEQTLLFQNVFFLQKTALFRSLTQKKRLGQKFLLSV